MPEMLLPLAFRMCARPLGTQCDRNTNGANDFSADVPLIKQTPKLTTARIKSFKFSPLFTSMVVIGLLQGVRRTDAINHSLARPMGANDRLIIRLITCWCADADERRRGAWIFQRLSETKPITRIVNDDSAAELQFSSRIRGGKVISSRLLVKNQIRRLLFRPYQLKQYYH